MDQVLITDFKFGVIKTKLITPYVLSFTTVAEITSLWVFLEDNLDRKGIGEAIPLIGYNSEDEVSISENLNFIHQDIIGKPLDHIHDTVITMTGKSPFAASAVATALDFLDWGHNFTSFSPIDLVYPISSDVQTSLVEKQVVKGMASGFKHFKVKIGRNVKNDLSTAKFLLKNYSDNLTFRFDANQAYTFEQCQFFCNELRDYKNQALLWLEQPLPYDAWQEMGKLCATFDFPFMLDESIYNESDIKQAKAIGCCAIKLKLFKHPGLNATLHLAKYAASLGLKTTLGNGVSSDIGNLGEAMIIDKARNIFVAGAECNGFSKIKTPVAFHQLAINDKGQMVWHGSTTFNLNSILATLQKKSTT